MDMGPRWMSMYYTSGVLVWLTVAGIATQLDWGDSSIVNFLCLGALAIPAIVCFVRWVEV